MADLLHTPPRPTRLLELTAGTESVLAAGAFDALSARLGRAAAEFAGVPLLFNGAGWSHPARVAGAARRAGLPAGHRPDRPTLSEFAELMGMPEVRDLEQRFS